MSQFFRRSIDLKFEIGTGRLGQSGTDVITVIGLRVTADIQRSAGASWSTASIRAYGVPLAVMNKLTTLGQLYPDIRQNRVTVTAGDENSGKAVVFSGIITEAFADFGGMPDVAFTVNAHTGIIDNLKPLPPTSFPEGADAATMAQSIATQMGYELENVGVQVRLPASYFPGTGRQQIEALGRAGRFETFVDDTAVPPRVVMIARGGIRNGTIPLISPATGLVGYPAYVQGAIAFRTIYNPNIRFRGNVQLETSLAPANGQWNVYEISHTLESEVPDGKWQSDIRCVAFGRETPNVR